MDIVLGIISFVAVGFVVAAWSHSHMRLEADAAGLHVVTSPRTTTTYPWADITEMRPSIAKCKKTQLVLVPKHGHTVDSR